MKTHFFCPYCYDSKKIEQLGKTKPRLMCKSCCGIRADRVGVGHTQKGGFKSISIDSGLLLK